MKVYVITTLIIFAIGCKPPANTAGQNKPAEIQKTGKVTVNGIAINYVEAGVGIPVILIHGSVSDYREWSKQITSLSEHYHVIAYSRRYHWPNVAAGPDADASLVQQVQDLSEFIKAIGIGPAHIVGHSFGGAIALTYTLQHPDRVKSLVLAEPAVSSILAKTPENDTVSKESQIIRAQMKEVFASGNAEAIAKTYADHVAPGDFEKATPEERKMLLDNVTAFQLDFTSQRLPFTCEDAQKITLAVLVMAGTQSPMGLQRIAETTAACIKGSKFVTIPLATHWMQHDNAKVFNDQVLAFLAEIEK